ncbi:phosphoglycerate kinase, partial [Candidatus Roizmanbacteria bacterium]|nr:phosphoglycerate kinase [Candidatus Roizmanbacteria bacterium]
MNHESVRYIDKSPFKGKKVLLRVDFNVTLNPNYTIADDARIKQAIPTIQFLLKHHNRLIIVSHLDRPPKRDPKYSLKVVVDHLKDYLPGYNIRLIDDFMTEKPETFTQQNEQEILVLENIRFYPEEKHDENGFSKKLAALADVFVNDAFGVSHRTDASVVGIPQHIPGYGGLLLKREIEMISKAIKKPRKPVVAIIGGAKISSKISLIDKLMTIADYVLIGGGLANTFLCAQGVNIGSSFCEYEKSENAHRLLFLAARRHTAIILPSDVVTSDSKDDENSGTVKKIDQITGKEAIYDIGPETQAVFGSIIAKAKTIIWNGPIGYTENPSFKRGTDF